MRRWPATANFAGAATTDDQENKMLSVTAQVRDAAFRLEADADDRVRVVVMTVVIRPRVVVIGPVSRCNDHGRRGRNFGNDCWSIGRCPRCVATAGTHLLGCHHHSIADALLTERD